MHRHNCAKISQHAYLEVDEGLRGFHGELMTAATKQEIDVVTSW
jgi:hypothetical protein